MKENERLSNKLNSIFWFVLTTLPIIMLLIVYLCGIPQYAKNYDWLNREWLGFITNSIGDIDFEGVFNEFDNMSIFFIRDTFDRVFENTFNITSHTAVAYLFGWMLSVQVYHLIYDVLKFIIGWCHHLIEKAYF